MFQFRTPKSAAEASTANPADTPIFEEVVWSRERNDGERQVITVEAGIYPEPDLKLFGSYVALRVLERRYRWSHKSFWAERQQAELQARRRADALIASLVVH